MRNFDSHLAGRRVWYKTAALADDTVHWHEGLEMVFVLSGKASFWVRGRTYDLYAEDLLVFNPFDLHIASSTGAAVLSLYLDAAFLQSLDLEIPRFSCCSFAMCEPQSVFRELREWLARCVAALDADDRVTQCLGEVYAHMILEILCRDFAEAPADSAPAEDGGDPMALQHVQHAVELFQKRYREDWTVQRLADEQHLSAGYLSRIFQAHMGLPVMKYLRTVRLRHARQEVYHSSRSITEIALENGFPSTTSFIEHFRRAYGQTPGQARHEAAQSPALASAAPAPADLSRLMQYCHPTPVLPREDTRYEVCDVLCDCAGAPESGKPPCMRMISIGWAKEAILAPIQDQIRQAQREIGFEFLRMHGIFDDSMGVFQGTLERYSFNFTYFDIVYDFILGLGLRPYMELSYMPSVLAACADTYYAYRCHICLPKDWSVWNDLVKATLTHCINRYGIDRVRGWLFTPISQCYVTYGCVTSEQWLRLYDETYHIVKSVDPALRFGGPGTDIDFLNRQDGALLRGFFDYSRARGCMPDFLGVQCFHVDFTGYTGPEVFRTVTGENPVPVPCSPDPDCLPRRLDLTERIVSDAGLSHLPVYLEGWNATLWQSDPCHDMRFKAAFVVKNFLQNQHRFDGINYWGLSDIMEEMTHTENVFRGGYGLLTTNGISKSCYYAFRLLSLMKGPCIGRGDGWFVTRHQETVAVMLYHYGHLSPKYNRLRVEGGYAFESLPARQFNLQLTGLREGVYTLSMYRIDAAHGSAWDIWMQMGSPQPMNAEQADYIKRVSLPRYTTCCEYLPRQYHYTTTLGVNEIELILCTPNMI